MAARKTATKAPKKTAKRAGVKSSNGFTEAEKAAMRERAREAKSETGEADVLEKIAEMPKSDRDIAERLHSLVMDVAPELAPRTWYGMPAYAKDGKVVCFFQNASKFKARYATLGFSDKANLDEGSMWPTSFALMKLGTAEQKKIRALVKRAVS